MKTFACLFVASLAVVPIAMAQSSAPKSTPAPVRQEPGSQSRDLPLGQLRVTGRVHVGEGAPDFTAPSSSGREVTLSRLKGNWLVLVFSENREDYASYDDVHQRLADVGVRLYGLCKEKAYRLRATVEEESLPFEIVADDTGEISALYGYYDWERRATAHGFVVMDRQGVVRLALQGEATPQQMADLVRFTVVGF